MKTKLILCAVLFSAVTFFTNAQPPRQNDRQGQGHAQGQGRQMISPEMRAENMAKQLELTDAQKAKVTELFKKQEVQMNAMREEMRAARESNTANAEGIREKVAAQRKANDAELEKIIGKEKMAKWQAGRQQQMQSMNERRRHGNGVRPEQGMQRPPMNNQPGRAERMEKVKEKFTPEKRAERLKTELELTDAQKDALVQLFDVEQKKMAEERKQKMNALKKEHETEVEKIIGKEKMAKYKELQKNRKEKVQKMRK